MKPSRSWSRLIRWTGALFILLQGRATSAAPPPTELQARMRASFTALAALQPLVASEARFSDPANVTRIETLIAVLSQTPHLFDTTNSTQKMPQEPGLAILVDQFHSYLANAGWQFRNRQYANSRAKLQSITSLCFACHTRLHADRDFQAAGQEIAALELRPIERADFLASTRQFDPALVLYRELLARAPKTERGHYETLRVLDRALTLLVRVKGDAGATVALLKSIIDQGSLPPAQLEVIKRWAADARAWRADPFDPNHATPEALIAKARALVESGPAGSSALFNERLEIRLLRASNYLHEALTRKPNSPLRSEALYLLARSTSTVGDPWLWQFDTIYLETCIREAPHTDGARRCFGALQNAKVLGYTGSSGTHLPDDELERLGEMRRLAY